ncbi:hypothetical protein LguiA_026972 [Lonicera macranthoides]
MIKLMLMRTRLQLREVKMKVYTRANPTLSIRHMESRVIFRCKFGDESAVFSLNNVSSFNDLCEVIRSKFPGISITDFTVKYVLPGSEPCILVCNDDMGFMFAFIQIVMVEHVELFIQLTEGPRKKFINRRQDIKLSTNLICKNKNETMTKKVEAALSARLRLGWETLMRGGESAKTFTNGGMENVPECSRAREKALSRLIEDGGDDATMHRK